MTERKTVKSEQIDLAGCARLQQHRREVIIVAKKPSKPKGKDKKPKDKAPKKDK